MYGKNEDPVVHLSKAIDLLLKNSHTLVKAIERLALEHNEISRDEAMYYAKTQIERCIERVEEADLCWDTVN